MNSRDQNRSVISMSSVARIGYWESPPTSPKAATSTREYSRILKDAQKTNDAAKIAWAKLPLALLKRNQGRYAEAIQLLNEIKETFQSTGEELGLATVYEELSFCSRELSRNALALDYCHQAITLFQKLGRFQELAWAYDNLAYICFFLYRRQDALVYAKKARSLFNEFDHKLGFAWNACNLGRLSLDMELFNDARAYYKEAIAEFQKLNNDLGRAWAHLGIATVYRALCRFDKVFHHLETARPIYQAAKFTHHEGWTFLNEAAIRRTIGQDEEAYRLNRHAMKLFESVKNHDGVAWSLFQIGQIYRDRGLLPKAWETFRSALTLHQDIANQKGIGWGENELGLTYLELNDLSHAQEHFHKAKSYANQIGLVALQIEVDKNLAALHLEEGLLQKGRQIIERALSECRRIQTWETLQEILMGKARAALLQGKTSEADEAAQEAAALIATYGFKRMQPTNLVLQGEIFMDRNEEDKALQAWEEALQLAQNYHQLMPRVQALLGLSQAKPAQKTLLTQLEKDARLINSKKIRVKTLLLKGWLNFLKTGVIDQKVFTQALRTLEGTGLTTLEQHALEVLIGLHEKAGHSEERAEIEMDLAILRDRGSVDLKILASRRPRITSFPVSPTA